MRVYWINIFRNRDLSEKKLKSINRFIEKENQIVH